MAEASLTAQNLRALVNGGVFGRGQDYFEDGAVRRLRRVDSRVEAEVWGGEGLYQTWLDLTPPFRSSCTCPYEGVCKHVVALGLAWLNGQSGDPEEETTPAPLTERLQELDEYELRDLLITVADEVSEARSVIDRWLLRDGLLKIGEGPGSGRSRERLAEINALLNDLLDSARLDQLVEISAQDWTEDGRQATDELSQLERELRDLVRALSELPLGGEYFAIPALELVCARMAAAEEASPDVSYCWNGAAQAAATALAQRLLAAGSAERREVQERLIPAFEAGARFLEPVLLAGSQDPVDALALAERLGTMGGNAVPTAMNILLQAGLAERAEACVSEWDVRDEGSLLLLAQHFRAEAMRDSASADRSGEAGWSPQPDPGLLAKSLSYYRRAAEAPRTWHGHQVWTELAEVCTACGAVGEAMDARVRLFHSMPSLKHWREAMVAAEAAGQRTVVKEELLSWLRGGSGYRSHLCEVLIEEAPGVPDRLSEAATVARQADSAALRLMVAKAAVSLGGEAERPIALGLLQEAADQLALQGGNYAYDQAAAVAHLLQEHFSDCWQEWFSGYISRHRRRRNLMQALARAGMNAGVGTPR